MKGIKIVHADDHSLFRYGVQKSLEEHSDIEYVGQAENGLKLLEILSEKEVDLVLLDIQMPVMDGISVLPEIKKRFPSVKVILLTMHNDADVITRVMKLGANAYLTKEAGSSEIYDAITTVIKEDFYFNELTNHALLLSLKSHRIIPNYHRPTEDLNDAEKTVLNLIFEDNATKKIADITELSIGEIEAIIASLKLKTGTKSIAGLIMYAIREGLVKK